MLVDCEVDVLEEVDETLVLVEVLTEVELEVLD